MPHLLQYLSPSRRTAPHFLQIFILPLPVFSVLGTVYKLLVQIAQDFPSSVPGKKAAHSGLCKVFLPGTPGGKDKQDV